MGNEKRGCLNDRTFAVAILTGCVAAVFGIYRVFANEQKCVAYESEYKASLNDLLRVTIDVDRATEEVVARPRATLGVMLLIDASSLKVSAIDSRIENFKGEYVSACGLKRAAAFIESPQVNSFLSRIEARRSSIAERAQYFKSQEN